MYGRYAPPAFDRLFDRAMVMPSGCWEYSGFCNATGHGVLRFGQRTWLAHRLAYLLCVDDIPDGMCVCHSCDNPPCVNPEHLWIGTTADNTYDMVAKKRHNRKLNDQAIAEVLQLLSQGTYHRVIAEKFGVTREAITKIANRGKNERYSLVISGSSLGNKGLG